MSKNTKISKFRLLFAFLLRLDYICPYSCPNVEDPFGIDYQEFSELAPGLFDTGNRKSDFSGSDIDPDCLASEKKCTGNTKVHLNFNSPNKTSNSKQEEKNVVKTVLNSYRNEFDRRYSHGSNYSEIFENLPAKLATGYLEARRAEVYSYSSFPSLYEIYEYLDQLEKSAEGRAAIFPLKYHNDRWKIVRTNFGNEILTIRISPSILVERKENPIIVVVAGIHGSDWYAIQSAIFLATELIINADRTDEPDFEWWIFPVLNPDGYEITRSDTRRRNWQKNLQEMPDAENEQCFGLDLDLNFEYQWLECQCSNYSNKSGANSPCDTNYPGEVPFTAPETRGLRDTLAAFDDRLDTFVALKEGKQMLVYPFSDTFETPRHVDSFKKISKRAVETFSNYVEGSYDYGQSSCLMNLSAGFIEDWAKVHLGVEKSFAFYLGPTIKDRRDLKSQHLMEHMNGTLALLNVIARGRIHEGVENSSATIYLSIIIYVAIIFPIFRQ